MANNYLSQPTARRKALLRQTDSTYADIARKIAAARISLRERNYNVDWYLTKFHGARPITNYAIGMEENWILMQHNKFSGNIALETPDPRGYSVTASGQVIHSLLTGVQ